ncbi:NAD(P)-dependent dehydrogenase, short-chain alcohol dehydrogenase family [Chitinophaga terrae (ex Kim and Jung 2007)]|uniref:NAD(P)-dependent dehydrogenase, short-chain alcohol dehydrogenase family n=1 Tax=Chitinophaga terrae (ex Kim and Jung 2007) TaxID=408074 RepID=A0A1H4GDR6_9BACT|nr:SDR family oxidoreductase [Chitinophaga terrae (ex Kim and Jung 2007)]GEP93349.1 short-chain dehydrogenase [Chitinophaga terrae (ex Kim and Jung 2007)]SEB07421.1 NAD(P)-dependent dehydrogenase, short-chain alcohol dehydrogenase family [Chitinophaga terrae (ex Kim and Jung 2007)]
MKFALVTGANKSIGFEVAQQLAQEGIYVYLGSRNLENGAEAVANLKAKGLNNVEALQLDITNDESVNNARKEIGRKTNVLDILINNAGIYGGHPQTALESTIEQFKAVYDANVYGAVRVTQAFIDLLKKSPAPRIVNVSSSQGSITLHSDPTYKYYDYKGVVYLSSKSALNMYTVVLAFELKNTPFKVNAVCPGFTKTDFNGNRGTGTVEDAGKRIVKYALIGDDGPTGKFFSEENNPATGEIPW